MFFYVYWGKTRTLRPKITTKDSGFYACGYRVERYNNIDTHYVLLLKWK